MSLPVPKCVKPPRDAYRYWPTGESIIKGSGKKAVRFIFENQKLTDFEKKKLDRLLEEIKNGKIEGVEVPKDWSTNHILRFCYGTGWKTRNSVKSLVSHLKWRKTVLPMNYKVLYPKVFEMLVRYKKNTGAFYIHGRDYLFRPLLVMNFAMINFKEYSIDDYSDLLCFLLEYIIDNMMLPGQIENWVVLTDLAKNGIGNLSVSSLKQVLGMLQANYKCRLSTNYILNPPKSIWIVWSCIKSFLDDITIDKIKISNSSYSQDMLAQFHPLQVEEKYGGKSANLEVFWPPTVPSQEFCPASKSIQLGQKDSYLKYNPKEEEEVVIERNQTKKLTFKLPSRVNSLELSVENSDVQLEDLGNDSFARSDAGEAEVLVDFEAVSPYTRTFERNPTFKEFGKMSSKKFEKMISIKAVNDRKYSSQSESSVDFDKDSKGGTVLEIQEKEANQSGAILEDPNSYCQCGRVQCGILKNSCVIS